VLGGSSASSAARSLVPVLLQELGDEPPPVPVVASRGEVTGEVDQRHRAVRDRLPRRDV